MTRDARNFFLWCSCCCCVAGPRPIECACCFFCCTLFCFPCYTPEFPFVQLTENCSLFLFVLWATEHCLAFLLSFVS
ncbi:GPI-anchored surface protein, putative [Bodo saltans]|uniref:GPI-anchored surface protein, putative n=1 Tax=Bodo saltans TaxID=75058 RepID=A0A0S4J3E3_BODSA|nr:GPI-anchored surface protein, putative [Bodo saltans]|eukprot:CUG69981.1 GPI-anchored surface protein, putative [Bodo saltans]